MENFRTLKLAKLVYQDLESVRLPSYARNQLRRAAYSVVLNLAEGNGYKSQLQRRKFFEIAYGSAQELKHGLSVFTCGMKLTNEVDALCAHLYNLKRWAPS